MRPRLAVCSGAMHDWSIEHVVAAAAQAGFAAIEWELHPGGLHINAADARGGARRCAGATRAGGLDVCAVSASPDVPLLNQASVATLVEACQAAGARIGRMFAPPVDRRIPLAQQLSAVSDALAAHAEGYSSHGVALVIELSQETVVPSPELLVRVCAGLDPQAVGALYDPGNMIVEGNLHPWLALEVLGEYLHHVHVKDEAFVRSADGDWTETVVQMGTGLVDWRAAFYELDDRGYRGWMSIDHLTGRATEDRLKFEKELLDAVWDKQSRGNGLAYRAQPA